MADRNELKLVTPAVPVRWASLHTPDYRFAKANDPRGTFSIECLLDPKRDADRAFLDELQEFWQAEYEYTCRSKRSKDIERHDTPWKEDKGDDGVPTGLVSIRPKNKEYFDGARGRVNVVIPQFDSQGTRIKVEVGNGSVCKVALLAFPFMHGGKFGVSLRLRSVQVIDLVPWTPYGFEPIEGGYTGQAYTPPENERQSKPDDEPDDRPVPPAPVGERFSDESAFPPDDFAY